MNRKARTWAGATLFLILILNYAIIGFPLVKRAKSIENRYRAIFLKQAKSGDLFKGSEEEYILEVFRRERGAIDRKIVILNCVAASAGIIIASWVIFGLVIHRKK